MSPSRSGHSSNLSGLWLGVFNYPRDFSPVSFSATLTQNGAWITGATEEIGQSSDAANRRITASLQGRRDGVHVKWLKLYDHFWLTYNAVTYEGDLSRDFAEISGRWTIPNSLSGTFLMIRAPKTAVASARDAADKI